MDSEKPIATEITYGYCPVCGTHVEFRCYEPIDFPCRRNTFVCNECGSVGRNRHIAKTVLDLFTTSPRSNSLRDFATNFAGTIYITCIKEAVYNALSGKHGLVASEYVDGKRSGEVHNGFLCQDLQATSFAENSFDLIITEDVLEHIPFPEKAFAEIRRILKPSGYHIGTIPVNWARQKSAARATIVNGEIRHLMEPEYHGDPLRENGILAFTDFGCDLVERFCSIIGPSQILSAHGDRLLEGAFGIYNNWVFVSQKTP